MKKLLYTFASDYGPFTPFENKNAWADFQDDVKNMPALISPTEAFGTPVYKTALNHMNKDIERRKYVQMTTSYNDVIKKDEEVAKDVEETDVDMNVDHSQFY